MTHVVVRLRPAPRKIYSVSAATNTERHLQMLERSLPQRLQQVFIYQPVCGEIWSVWWHHNLPTYSYKPPQVCCWDQNEDQVQRCMTESSCNNVVMTTATLLVRSRHYTSAVGFEFACKMHKWSVETNCSRWLKIRQCSCLTVLNWFSHQQADGPTGAGTDYMRVIPGQLTQNPELSHLHVMDSCWNFCSSEYFLLHQVPLS